MQYEFQKRNNAGENEPRLCTHIAFISLHRKEKIDAILFNQRKKSSASYETSFQVNIYFEMYHNVIIMRVSWVHKLAELLARFIENRGMKGKRVCQIRTCILWRSLGCSKCLYIRHMSHTLKEIQFLAEERTMIRTRLPVNRLRTHCTEIAFICHSTVVLLLSLSLIGMLLRNVYAAKHRA